jgi:hypothetical protein
MRLLKSSDKTGVMGINRTHILGALPTLLLGAMVCMVLAVAGISQPDTAPAHLSTHSTSTDKAELLASLSSVNGASCDPGGMFLFADDAPLMVVWMASEPAELYNGTGDFAGPLSRSELAILMDATRLFTESCQAAEPAPITPLRYNL